MNKNFSKKNKSKTILKDGCNNWTVYCQQPEYGITTKGCPNNGARRVSVERCFTNLMCPYAKLIVEKTKSGTNNNKI